MKTQEVIEFVKSEFDYMDYVAFKKEAPFEAGIFQQKKDEVISLLQRGEKYEAMFKIFVQFIFNWRYPISHKVMRDKVRELRQRYFPKEVNKSV